MKVSFGLTQTHSQVFHFVNDFADVVMLALLSIDASSGSKTDDIRFLLWGTPYAFCKHTLSCATLLSCTCICRRVPWFDMVMSPLGHVSMWGVEHVLALQQYFILHILPDFSQHKISFVELDSLWGSYTPVQFESVIFFLHGPTADPQLTTCPCLMGYEDPSMCCIQQWKRSCD